MSSVARRSAGAAALANREQYLRLLHETLPDLPAGASARGPLRGVPRTLLRDAAAAEPGALSLPEGWLPSATRALALACTDIVDRETIERADWCLCALVHPTHLATSGAAAQRRRLAELRRTVAMPWETAASGAAALRLVHEVRAAHEEALRGRDALAAHPAGPSRGGPISASAELAAEELPPTLSAATLSRIPRVAGLEQLILYDPAFFGAHAGDAVPEEVLVACTTSLCGAISLCTGTRAVSAFLDRMLARVAPS